MDLDCVATMKESTFSVRFFIEAHFFILGMVMEYKDVEGFKTACREYLKNVNLNILRSYGRMLQLRKPTAMRKEKLTERIIGVLCGEIIEQRNGKRGAPIRGESVTQDMLKDIELMKTRYLCGDKEINSDKEKTKPIIIQCTVQVSGLSEKQKNLFVSFLESIQNNG